MFWWVIFTSIKRNHPVKKAFDMKNRFVISDTHFGHAATVEKFKRPDGSPLRDFSSCEEMDNTIVENWNKVVGDNDVVYHLGDVVINRKFLPILERLKGDLVLIKGNHDIFKLSDYTKYFRDIRAYHVVDNIIFSHIPIHVESKERFRANVHGHLHWNLASDGKDPFYKNVCVERINYTPISLDEIKSLL